VLDCATTAALHRDKNSRATGPDFIEISSGTPEQRSKDVALPPASAISRFFVALTE
jgi:hypothetical protein